jgi:hypothetical protein
VVRLRVAGLAALLLGGAIAAAGCSDDEVEVVRVVMWTDYVDVPGATQGTEMWMGVDGDGPVWNAGMTFDTERRVTNASASGPGYDNYYSPGDDTARCDEVDGARIPQGLELPEGEWWRFWEISDESLAGDGFERSDVKPLLPGPPFEAGPDPRAGRSVVPDYASATAWAKEGVIDTSMTPGLRYYLVDADGYQVASATTTVNGERAFSHQLLLIDFFEEEDGEAAMAERFRWDEWCDGAS